VLHTPIYEFVPFLRIESFDELLTFFLCNYVVENIETWYGSSVSSFCIREVYNWTFLQILLLKSGVKENKNSFVEKSRVFLHQTFHDSGTLLCTVQHEMTVIGTRQDGNLFESIITSFFLHVAEHEFLISLVSIAEMRNKHIGCWLL